MYRRLQVGISTRQGIKKKRDTMNAKLYDQFISDLELKGYAKRSINS